MSRGGVSSFRLFWVFLAFVACFGAVVARLVELQLTDRGELVAESERMREKFKVLPARRGNILDRNQNILATTHTVREVGVDPESLRVEDRPQWAQLARILKMDRAELENMMRTEVRIDSEGKPHPVRWRELADVVSEEDYEKIQELGIKGVYGNRKYRRAYPGGQLAAHVLGYTNLEGAAVTGIEYSLDFYLRGQDGWLETERDGKRRELVQYRHREIPAVPGMNVRLTIDEGVQAIIETELQKIMEKYAPKGATIVVSNPSTGQILGMASAPTFNPNHYFDFDQDSQRNRVIKDIYEPGSVFKVVPVSAGLSEELIDVEQQFDCGIDRVSYQGRVVRLPGEDHDFGKLSVADIIAKSSNRGAAQVGMTLGDSRLYRFTRAFGFGEKSGILLGGEVAGIVHAPKDWDGLTISRMPMGHAIAVTPLQAHFSMATLANDGVLMKPQIAEAIYDSHGEQVAFYEAQPVRRVVSSTAARTMSQLLVRAVNEGTGKSAAIPGMEVAGKTGTTQPLVNGRYVRNSYVGSFIGYFPASDPRLVISVVVDRPTKLVKGYGAQIAAPSFNHVAEELINLLGITPSNSIRGFLAMETF